MRVIITKLVFVLLCVLSTTNSNAQQNIYTGFSDSIFQHLDKNQITTGILYDRVYPAAELHAFDIASDTVIVDLWEQAYLELYHSAYSNLNWLRPEDQSYIRDVENFQSRIPIGILDYSFNWMDTLAVQNNLFTYQNGLLYDVPNRPSSPYWEKRVQMACPLYEEIKPGLVQFYLPQYLIMNNQGLTVQQVSLNIPAIGSIVLQPGTFASLTFTGSGNYNGQITVQYSNGSIFTNLFSIEIGGESFSERTTAEVPCYQQEIFSTVPFQGYEETQPYIGRNTINIFYRLNDPTIGNCPSTVSYQLRKPIIIIDGYDPIDKRNASIINELLFTYTDGSGNQINLAENLRLQGYDIIIVDAPIYTEGTVTIQVPIIGSITFPRLVRGGGDYIERNGLVLVDIIELVKQRMVDPINEKIVIVGPSMGGQISRYALAYMEANNMDHNCRLWISFDSPHLGATLPIGQQNVMNQLSGVFSKIGDVKRRQVDVPAAKQMLIHHYSANSESPAGAPGFFNRYYGMLDQLGWPQNLRKVSATSGSHNGVLISPGNPCEDAATVYAKPKKWVSMLLQVILGTPGAYVGNAAMDIAIRFSPDKNADRCRVSDIRINGWIGNIGWPTYATHSSNRYNASIDLLNSGYYPGFKELADHAKGSFRGISKFVNVILRNFADNHAHELTGSTLAYGKGPTPNPNRKWDDDITDINLVCEGEIPFDAYQGPQNFNTRHNALYEEQAIWIEEEINGIIHNNKKHRVVTVYGDDIGYVWCANDTRRFYASNPPSGTTLNWATSDPNLIIINGQGTAVITVQYLGTSRPPDRFTISLNAEDKCNIYTGSKKWQNVPFDDLTTVPGTLTDIFFTGPLSYSVENTVSGNTAIVELDLNLASGVFYELLYADPVPYTWSQSGNQMTINVNTAGIHHALFRFRVTYTHGCDGLPRSNQFVLIFPGSSGRSYYTVEGNNLVLHVPGFEKNLSLFEVSLFDMSGKLIRRHKGYNSGNRVNVSIDGLANGVYILHLYSPKGVIIRKVLVNR